jgi:hypothetical protein
MSSNQEEGHIGIVEKRAWIGTELGSDRLFTTGVQKNRPPGPSTWRDVSPGQLG